MIKTLSKLGIREIPPSKKMHLHKSYSQLYNGERQCFSHKIGNKARLCALTTSVYSLVLVVQAGAVMQGKEIKGIQIGKEEVKLFLLTSMINL